MSLLEARFAQVVARVVAKKGDEMDETDETDKTDKTDRTDKTDFRHIHCQTLIDDHGFLFHCSASLGIPKVYNLGRRI